MPAVLSVGSIDEKGFLEGLFRKGFTIKKALAELFANCLDAGATRIIFRILREFIRATDNGSGMTEAGLTIMFAMHRQNHARLARRGVSGVGKSSYVLLSKQGTMWIFTRVADGDYLCATVPWGTMFAEGKYSGMITIRPMTPEEVDTFNAEHPEGHGTSVVFPYSRKVADAIRENFPSGANSELPALDRLGVIFGNDAFTATLEDRSKEPETMLKYNYFGDSDADYVCGISNWRIDHYQIAVESDAEDAQKDRFILVMGLKQYEITPQGTGFGKKPKDRVPNLVGYDHIGHYTIVLGLRNDAIPADDLLGDFTKSPPVLKNRLYISSVDDASLGSEMVCKEFLVLNKLVRNGQKIGCFKTPDFAVGSARANAEAMLTYGSIQVELRYNPTSEQNNPQDKLIGIQENKNQYSGEHLPVTLTRLIKFCREEKAKEIMASLNARLAAIARIRSGARAAAAASEEEEEDDDEE
jgi:hypothetical protein